MGKKSIKAEEFDAIFDNGDETTEYLIVEEAERPGLLPRRVSIDFPA